MRLAFPCPNCRTAVPIWPGLRRRFSRQGRRGKRQCPACGAWLELRNAYRLGMVWGLVLGVLVGPSNLLLPWDSDWARLAAVCALAFAVSSAMSPLVLVRFGRWRVLPDGYHDSAEVVRWTRLMNVSIWAGLAAMWLTGLAVYFEARRSVARLAAIDRPEAWDALFRRTELIVVGLGGAGLLAGAALVAFSLKAAARRERARDAEHPPPPSTVSLSGA